MKHDYDDSDNYDDDEADEDDDEQRHILLPQHILYNHGMRTVTVMVTLMQRAQKHLYASVACVGRPWTTHLRHTDPIQIVTHGNSNEIF